MTHYPDHHKRLSELIDSLGLVAYGCFWVLNELILSSPEKSMSKSQLIKATDKLIRPELVMQLLGKTEHFYEINGKYFSELDRKRDLTSADAENSLNKAGLSGRGFTRIIQIHGVSEKFMMTEFEKWKKSRELEVFKDDRHIFNSFNMWMRNCEKEKVKKPTNEIDWSKV